MSDSPIRVSLGGAVVLAMLLIVVEPGCRRQEGSEQKADRIMAFIADMSSNAVDAPPSQYTVFMCSGHVFQFNFEDELREAKLNPSETAQLHEALLKSGLASHPEGWYIQSDAHHFQLGIRENAKLKTYAWRGDASMLDPNASESFRKLIDAWTKARTAMERATPDSWAPVTNGSHTIDQLVAEIHGQ